MDSFNRERDQEVGNGEGNEEGLCLVCGESSNFVRNEANPDQFPTVLSNSVHVYFLLRHVLELPSEQIEKYLRSCPYPENWVKICRPCGVNYVDKCKRIFMELVEVKRRFHGAKMEVLERIKRSEVPDEEKESGQVKRGNAAQLPCVLDIWKETRTFVHQYDYGPSSVDPYFFQAGDSMAREKAVEMMSKIENKRLPSGDDTIPNLKDDGDIKTEPSSPFAHSETKFSHGYPDSVEDEPNSEHDQSAASEESCSEYDPHEEAVSPSSSPNHSNASEKEQDFEEIPPVLDNPSIKRKGRFPCPQCSKVLSFANSLKRHMAAFHLKNRQKLNCSHCEKEFADNRSLRHHLATVHQLQEYLIHPCTFKGCNKSFAHKQLLQFHQLSHKSPEYSCPICGKEIAVRTLFKRHVAQCKLQGEKPYKCDQCPVAYARKDNLAAHIKRNHGGDGGVDCKKKITLMWSQYKCSECGVKAARRRKLQEHVDKMHAGNATITKIKIGENPRRKKSQGKPSFKPTKKKKSEKIRKVRIPKNILECPQCDWITVSEELLKRHQRKSHTDQDATFTCSYEGCHRTFSNIRRLASHTRAHKQPKNFKCDLCPRQFLREVGLENHKKLRHSAEAIESFKCPFCAMTLSSKQTLDVHLYRKHRQEKRDIDEQIFTCDLCSLTFVRETCLIIHKRQKHNPKPAAAAKKKKLVPLQCSKCGQMLSSSSALNYHINAVHEKKRVICDVCGTTLKSRHYMKIHLKTVHNIGDCEVLKHLCTVEGCGKRFYAPCELQRHVDYVHEGSCKFQCETCGKRVISAKNLRRHIQAMHTNREDKPWKCDECGKSFAINEYLWLHKKTHQPKEAKVKVETKQQQ